jgi:hypothetical protein
VVGSLELIYLVAASGHNYLALIRQGGLNPLTVTKKWLISSSMTLRKMKRLIKIIKV